MNIFPPNYIVFNSETAWYSKNLEEMEWNNKHITSKNSLFLAKKGQTYAKKNNDAENVIIGFIKK